VRSGVSVEEREKRGRKRGRTFVVGRSGFDEADLKVRVSPSETTSDGTSSGTSSGDDDIDFSGDHGC
jgi:hypothetical protein